MAAICKARPFPFSMGCLSCSAFQIDVELPSAAFKDISTAFEVAVIIIWCVVAVGTTKGALRWQAVVCISLGESEEGRGGTAEIRDEMRRERCLEDEYCRRSPPSSTAHQMPR
jgi:hypothetical protein